MLDDLYALLRADAEGLQREFAKASISGRGTPQEVADFREHALQAFVKRFFPFPHRVTKGKIRDSHGELSDSIDCVLCAPNHPYTIDSNEKFQLILAEGVDAAIEVKPDLASLEDLRRGLEQGLTVKALRRATEPTLDRIPWMVERAKRVPFAIFAMQCKREPMDTGREIVSFYRERGIAPLEQADFIAVNGVGIFANYLDATQCHWNFPSPPAEKTGWFFEQWELNTLAGLLQHLHGVAHAEIKMQKDILPFYLMPTAVRSVKRIEH